MSQTPKEIVSSLIDGREDDRERAQEHVGQLEKEQRVELRQLVLDAIDDNGRPYMSERDAYWANAWLMSTLARVADKERKAQCLVRGYVETPELDEEGWIRYWTLAGLVAAVNDLRKAAPRSQQKAAEKELQELAARLLENRSERRPRFVDALCWAILAMADDNDALEHLRRGLQDHENLEHHQAMLRGLRVVPVPKLVEDIADVAKADPYMVDCYGAIVALGSIPPEYPEATTAARALATVVADLGEAKEWSELRTKAFIGLGRLRARQYAPMLVERMVDENPATVRAAATALERALGVETAVDRVVEAVVAEPDRTVPYARALRWMDDREGVVEALGSLRIGGRGDCADASRRLLIEVGGAAAFAKLRARASTVDQYRTVLGEAEERVGALFDESLSEAGRGFRLATLMDMTVFFLGTALILASAAWALVSEGALDNWLGIGVTAGLGAVGVLYSLFVSRPRYRVKEAVDHLMYLKIVFLGYLRQLHQIDQAYSRRMLEDRELTPEDAQAFTRIVDITMTSAIERLLIKDLEPPPKWSDLPEVREVLEGSSSSATTGEVAGRKLSGVA